MTTPNLTAARLLHDADSVCVSTGAGMSKESGIDTFRGDDGLWSKFNVQELATPEAFRRDPVKVWDWYRTRRKQLANIQPHQGHHLLADWQDRVPNFTLITQNIDGLHTGAGSRNVIELHGRLDTARCTDCDYTVQSLDDLGPDPRCPSCNSRLRPGVVWFGEALPPGAIEAAFDAVQRCDVFMVIGTSGMVQPAASLADAAQSRGAKIIEVNPNTTDMTYLADIRLPNCCQAALVDLDSEWQQLNA